MKKYEIQYCNRCKLGGDDDFLREIAYNEKRYVNDLLKKARQDKDSALHQEAAQKMEERLDESGEDEECEEDTEGQFQTDQQEEGDERGLPRPGKDDISREDLEQALDDYKEKGLLDIQDGKVLVTPKGVRKLAANALERILRELRQKSAGVRHLPKEDFGMELSFHTRRYEAGDDYACVDIEKTALNALKRCGELKFEPEDFEIREEMPQSKLVAGIIIDESGSMRDSGKLEAAMETALVLSKLILKEPENTLRIYIFSDEVKKIEPWQITNDIISGGDTDIRGALAAFRRSTRHEYGDKQAYLITDTEPNNEDGRHISFRSAEEGLIEEAAHYRQEKIGLNIIMLDETPKLKGLASTIAQRNLGKVFFTAPGNMGEVLVEDYLKRKRPMASAT